ncbi:MAG: hypothetical protein KME31_33670 [Tolypothrix carrinoi HA7290-LM1]|nr:hypothetical protein [Tolypothrix carrinoi HA7290-LM1]
MGNWELVIGNRKKLSPHAPCPILHSPLPIPHSPLPIPHSPFPIPHYPLSPCRRKLQ